MISESTPAARVRHADALMKLYGELAEWWPLFSSRAAYRAETTQFRRLIQAATKPAPRTLLELGSGGGNSAHFLKRHFQMTLVDLSPQMLGVSRSLNPECEHVKGDIRRVRLGRQFDAVYVHDAICHMTTEASLLAAMKTAFVHCRPGGIALFVPDFVRETFVPGTDQGGSDSDGGGVRFLQWMVDPNPRDSTYVVDFAIILRDRQGRARVVHDRHVQGLFPRARWLALLRQAGFRARAIRDGVPRDVFLARRPRYA